MRAMAALLTAWRPMAIAGGDSGRIECDGPAWHHLVPSQSRLNAAAVFLPNRSSMSG